MYRGEQAHSPWLPGSIESPTIAGLPFVVRTSSSLVWIVAIDTLDDLEGIAAKVLLVNNTFMADHKGVYSGDRYWAGVAINAKPPIMAPLITKSSWPSRAAEPWPFSTLK